MSACYRLKKKKIKKEIIGFLFHSNKNFPFSRSIMFPCFPV